MIIKDDLYYMKTFLLLHEFQDSFNMLSDEEAGQLIKAIFVYETTWEEPCFEDRAMTMAFSNIRRFLDSSRENYQKVCKQRSEYAKKRWEKQEEKKKVEKEKAEAEDARAYLSMLKHAQAGNNNANVNDSVNVKVKENVNVNDSDNVNVNVNVKSDTEVSSPAPTVQSTQAGKSIHTHKNTFGEFKNVFLTPEEYKRLTERFPDYLSRIESFSAYMKATGKTYRDHYAQLINWHSYTSTAAAKGNTATKKPPGERREPTFDVSAFTKKAVGIKYVPPEE